MKQEEFNSDNDFKQEEVPSDADVRQEVGRSDIPLQPESSSTSRPPSTDSSASSHEAEAACSQSMVETVYRTNVRGKKRKAEMRKKEYCKKIKVEQATFKVELGKEMEQEVSTLSQKIGKFVDTATEEVKSVSSAFHRIAGVFEKVGEAAVRYLEAKTANITKEGKNSIL